MSGNTYRALRKTRVVGTPERPRLCVSITNRHVIAQIIDDTTGKTIAFSDTASGKVTGSMTKKAEWAGADIAKKAKKAKVKQVAYDRGNKIYHGRIKALAEAARENGLEF